MKIYVAPVKIPSYFLAWNTLAENISNDLWDYVFGKLGEIENINFQSRVYTTSAVLKEIG